MTEFAPAFPEGSPFADLIQSIETKSRKLPVETLRASRIEIEAKAMEAYEKLAQDMLKSGKMTEEEYSSTKIDFAEEIHNMLDSIIEDSSAIDIGSGYFSSN